MPAPSPREAPSAAFGRVAGQFAAVAACVEGRRSDDEVLRALSDAQSVCDQLAAAEGSATTTQLLQNVKTVFETWRQVWPRLGSQHEFRQAVAREARLWAKRLSGSAG